MNFSSIVGNSPTLLRSKYIRPNRKRKIDGDYFEVVYKSEDGVTRRAEIPAEITIYFTKPEFRNHDNINKTEEDMHKLQPVQVMFSKVIQRIAEEIGEAGENYVKYCFENRDYKGLKKLYAWPYVYKADFQPEFYLMQEWFAKYKMPSKINLTKTFADIEADLIDYPIDMNNIRYSNAPVNLITATSEDLKEVYTFVLKPYKPPKMGYTEEEYKKRYELYESQLKQHTDLMNNLQSFVNELHKDFDKVYGKLDYHIREYDKEIELIADYFRYINNRKPDYCMFYNMRFDIPYLINRIEMLGYNPGQIICHPDWPTSNYFFYQDNSTYELKRQSDSFDADTYTQYICQLRLYTAIRKSQAARKSNSLNYIANLELGEKKVEYPDETNMKLFAYIDWKRFIKYNIKDTLLQMGIERVTNDIMTMYTRSMINLTPYSKIFRETHFLRNVREKYFEMQKIVQSNNINILHLDEQEVDKFYQTETADDTEDDNAPTKKGASFKGAIVAVTEMNDFCGVLIHGKRSKNLYINAIDMDMSAFYPSGKIWSNMGPMQLEYKASFDNKEFIDGDMLNRSLNTTYREFDKNGVERDIDVTGECVNHYMTGNLISFGYAWLGLPSIKDMFAIVKDKMS